MVLVFTIAYLKAPEHLKVTQHGWHLLLCTSFYFIKLIPFQIIQYLSESPRSGDELVDGDDGYHEYGGAGESPAEHHGPRRVRVVLVLEWLLVQETEYHHTLGMETGMKENKELNSIGEG